MKKIIVSAIIIGLLLSATSLSVSLKESTLHPYENILYVGGTGPGNYSTIKAAIDAASTGDTIFVYSGTYPKFEANKKLNIIGENRDYTIVNGNYIKASADGVNISNFTFKGVAPPEDWWLLSISGSNISIENCLLYSPEEYYPLYGIDMSGSYNIIKNCEIYGFDYRGIQMLSATYCTIENCIIAYSSFGIQTLFDGAQYNTIKNCELYRCGWAQEPGAAIQFCTENNYVSNCNIYFCARGIDFFCSDYNEVTDCNIHDNDCGIHVRGKLYLDIDWSQENKIIGNNIYYNKIGIHHPQYSKNNIIYHNNFVLNSQHNSYDDGIDNTWDNNYPSGGNYWSDYTGSDGNGDDIGDTPYYISGDGNSQDRYPLMDLTVNIPPMKPNKPSGSTNGLDGIEYEYSASTEDPNGDKIYYKFSWGDRTESEWLGPYNSGETATTNKAWANSGVYNVKVITKDDKGSVGIWSDALKVNIGIPSKPIIDGPKTIKSGEEYEYVFMATDPDGDDLYYWISWYDGNYEEWIGPYASGETVKVSHTWEKKGEYRVYSRVKDIHGAEGPGASIEIIVPRNTMPYRTLLMRLFERFPNAFPILRLILGL